MNIVWLTSPASAARIVEALESKKAWKPRTTRTFLDRLVKKKALLFRKEGRRYEYSPGLSQAACVRDECRIIMNRVFDGRPAAMLINLLKEAELSSEEIQELKRALRQKEKSCNQK